MDCLGKFGNRKDTNRAYYELSSCMKRAKGNLRFDFPVCVVFLLSFKVPSRALYGGINP